MLSRRTWIQVVPLTGLSLALSAQARAAGALAVAAPNRAVGAIVAATTGSTAQITINGTLSPTQLGLGSVVVDIGSRVHLPPGARASRNFLDDARNAPKLGGNIRNALVQQRPDLKDKLTANHKAWTRTFARKIMAWNHALEQSPVRGQRIADVHGRHALLNWAGATLEPKSSNKGPAALARLPREPDSNTLQAYIRYIDSLVAALR